MNEPIRIPLRRHDGTVRAYALIDVADAEQGEHRWCLRSNRYAGRMGNHRRIVFLHRVLMGLTFGDGFEVDHINGDSLDNRRANLRVVTHAQNGQNVASLGGTSKHRGVSWFTGHRKWQAVVKIAGNRHHLGYFASEEDAAAVARAFRLEHMPFTVER